MIKINKSLAINIVLVLFEISCMIVEISVNYELSENKSFPWKEAAQNKLIWGLVAIQFIYNILMYVYTEKRVDKLVEKKVLKKGTKRLYSKIINDTCKNKYDDANETMNILKNLKEVVKDD